MPVLSTPLSTVESLTITLIDNFGNEINLTKMFLELDIFESIFEQFMTGKLIILDSLDMIANVPIIGNETLQLDIDTNQYDAPIKLDFTIYKIDKDVQVQKRNVKNKMYIVYFCSDEIIKNFLHPISRKFSDFPENVLQWILTNAMESEKTLTSTATAESIDFHSNFWKSSDIIKYLSVNSSTSEYSDYIFYEDFSGFNFKPVSELLSESSLQTLTYETTSESFIKLNNIRSFKFETYFDLLTLLKVGFFGSTLFKHDVSNYEYTKTESVFSDRENDITSLGKYSFFQSSLSNATNKVDVNYMDHDIININSTQQKLLNQYNIVAKMNGDFSRKCGMVVDFSFPNTDNESPTNDQFDGNWLINGIKHIFFQNTSYEQNVLLSKNSAFDNDKLESITSLKNI